MVKLAFSSILLLLFPVAALAAGPKYTPSPSAPPSRPTPSFKNSAPPRSSTTNQFNNASNQKPYANLKPVPTPQGQQEKIRQGAKTGQKGAIKDDFKAQANRQGPHNAVKKADQGGGAGPKGKDTTTAKVDNPLPGGGPTLPSARAGSGPTRR